MMFAWVIIGVTSVPLLIMAVFLLQGKGGFLIAGFNTMNKAKRVLYDEKALCKSTGWLLLITTILVLLLPLSLSFNLVWLTYSLIVLMVLVPVGAVIYFNTGNRFKKTYDPNDNEPGRPSTDR